MGNTAYSHTGTLKRRKAGGTWRKAERVTEKFKVGQDKFRAQQGRNDCSEYKN